MTVVAEALERARAAVAELTAVVDRERSLMAGDDLHSLVVGSWALGDELVAVTTASVGEWDARGVFRADGSRSATARLARDVGCSRATAGRAVRRARFLRQFSRSAEALAEGTITLDKADVLARAAIPARRDLFADAEPGLLLDATRLGCDDLSKVVTFWADAADDHLGRDRSKGQHDGRRLSYGRSLDGSLVLDGRLDPVAGAIVAEELDRLAQQLFEEDWALAREQFGQEATANHLIRTAAHRRADALSIMATRSAAMPAGSKAPRPLYTVLMDLDTARRICQLADGTPISPGSLVPWSWTAEFERAVFDSPSRVIDIGRRTRLFRGALRRAIEVRDQHCTFPGCTVPAARCDVDHVVEYVDGGLTTQANGRLRCPAHNRQRPGRTDGTSRAGPDP